MATLTPSPRQMVSRVLAALLAGYGFTWGATALGAVLLYVAGMDLNEATALATMLGLVLYLVVFCWAFAARRLTWVWVALAGGGAFMAGVSMVLARTLS